MKKVRFALVIVVLTALFHFIPFFNPAESWLVRGFLGIGFGLRQTALSVGAFFGDITRVGKLESENDFLKKKIIELDEKLVASSSLFSENESLKGLLSFRERSDLQLIPAIVIGSDPDATVRALVIDRGSEDGVERGDPVIAGNGTLIGKIERVSAGRSSVLLPTDPRSAIAVMIADHPEADGVAEGEKGLVVSMTLIPQHAPVTVGATVITTGRENRIPRGLILGTIESINNVPSDPFMSATISPTINPMSLTRVAILHQK